MKKISITLLALVLALGCALGLVACGGGTVKMEFVYTLNDDGASYAVTNATYNGKEYKIADHKNKLPEEVTVPAEHDGKPVTIIKFMSHGENVKKVNLPETIVEIGEFAFSHYESLTSIKIGDNVEKIGNSAFKDIATLESVNIGENSKLRDIGPHAFSGTGIKSFKAPASLELRVNLSSSDYRNTQGIFENCAALEIIDLSAIATEDISINLANHFATGCPALKTVILPNKRVALTKTTFDLNTADRTTIYMLADELEGFSKINDYYYDYGTELGINDCAFIGNIYFYSEIAPTNNVSNWWHYVDGVPTKW